MSVRCIQRPLLHQYSKLRTTEIVTGFDKAWSTMKDEQKAQVIKEYAALEAGDWHTLTIDQKRATNPPPKTLAPEYKRAQEEYLKSQNSNPIFGLSAKKEASDDDITL
ncbi:hypothetical protein PSACC_03728 [Paramicrosporidium saccamoebae]|uniref:Uncharacterized protein n=1 Tax=Paramicrosporidium saccamoebae TaxID=1246581 RepID=A0A2H9TF98_9FUNG|nr:hypothetical protein PSACC_03728 [Paramicrosporidium saccamoebae]